jgi:hypothetical protein
LGLDAGEGAHFGDDGGNEEGEGGEGDVAVLCCVSEWQNWICLPPFPLINSPTKITNRRNPRLRIPDPLPQLLDPHALLLLNIDPLVPRRHVQRHLFLPLAQEISFHDTIRDQEQTRDGKQARRHAFDDKQESPGRHGAFDLRNAVRERAAVGVCHCGAADEDAVPETDFGAGVEEAEVEGHAGAEHCCFV